MRLRAADQPHSSRLRGFLDSDERQPAASRRRERRYRRLLAFGDLFAGSLALAISGPAVGDSLQPLAFVTPLLVVIAAKVVGLYDQDELKPMKSTLDEVPSLFDVACGSSDQDVPNSLSRVDPGTQTVARG